MKKQQFLSVEEINNLNNSNNFLSINNILLSKYVSLGKNNTFYPSVYIEIKNGGSIKIGDNNTFYPNTYILADKGKIVINDNNIFDNNINIKANIDNSFIEIKSNCRFLNNIIIMGNCYFGNGSQAIGGFITIQNCNLEDGDDFNSPDIDKRAGVLKGFGLAKNLTIDRGNVIHGYGNFDLANIEPQTNYHK